MLSAWIRTDFYGEVKLFYIEDRISDKLPSVIKGRNGSG